MASCVLIGLLRVLEFTIVCLCVDCGHLGGGLHEALSFVRCGGRGVACLFRYGGVGCLRVCVWFYGVRD